MKLTPRYVTLAQVLSLLLMLGIVVLICWPVFAFNRGLAMFLMGACFVVSASLLIPKVIK